MASPMSRAALERRSRAGGGRRGGRSGSRHYVNAYGERVDWTPSYDPDEAF